MKGVQFVWLFLFPVFLAGAQSQENSLDLTYPAFTPQQRETLIEGDGLYFKKVLYISGSMSRSMFGGNGFASGSIGYSTDYEFHKGAKIISQSDFFNLTGFGRFVDSFQKADSDRKGRRLLAFVAGIPSGTVGILSAIGLAHPSVLSAVPQGVLIGTSILGIGVLGYSLINLALSPALPEPPSDEELSIAANRENRKILSPKLSSVN